MIIIMNHAFSLPFAEVERQADECISASGIRQKDPHVGGVTNWPWGGE
jgi:hypothetical protein